MAAELLTVFDCLFRTFATMVLQYHILPICLYVLQFLYTFVYVSRLHITPNKKSRTTLFSPV